MVAETQPNLQLDDIRLPLNNKWKRRAREVGKKPHQGLSSNSDGDQIMTAPDKWNSQTDNKTSTYSMKRTFLNVEGSISDESTAVVAKQPRRQQ